MLVSPTTSTRNVQRDILVLKTCRSQNVSVYYNLQACERILWGNFVVLLRHHKEREMSVKKEGREKGEWTGMSSLCLRVEKEMVMMMVMKEGE